MTPPGGAEQLSFAEQAYRGESAPWRAVLALLFILPGTYLLVYLTVLAYSQLGIGAALVLLTMPEFGSRGLVDEFLAFLFLMISIIAVLPLMRLVLPWLHRRPWLSFVTARPRFDWALFAQSFGAMLALAGGTLLLTLWLSPGELHWTAKWRSVALFAPFALVLLSLQVLTEEVFFRGYLMQLTGRVARPWLIRLVVPALLFAAAHSANPEASYDFFWASANYLLLALYLGAISLKGDGLEASAGLHLANNLYVALVVGLPVSVSPGPTLWLSGPPDFKMSFLEMPPLLALHYMFIFWLAPKIWPHAKQR